MNTCLNCLCCTELFNFANKLLLYWIVLISDIRAGVFVIGTLVSSGCFLHSCQFYTSFYLKLLDFVKTKRVRYAKTRSLYIKHETSHTNTLRICSVSVPTYKHSNYDNFHFVQFHFLKKKVNI